MDKDSIRNIVAQFPTKSAAILSQFIDGYRTAAGEISDPLLMQFLTLALEQTRNPFTFKAHHTKVRSPTDYYRFGTDFLRPLIDLNHSQVHGIEVLDTIQKQLLRKENVILLANHQTETDPQALSILLENTHPAIGEHVTYVAGERVVTDPLAIPFSMGCDLLCIYSKRYIDSPPELKMDKLLHNKRTMELMSQQLKQGGQIIYVAPSGGRDRRNEQGVVEVAPFDAQSIEMFYLMARKAKTPTHFYPLTLSTYDLLPPPVAIQKELGERRIASRCAIAIAIAPSFDMEKFPGSEDNDKLQRRQARASALWNIVNTNYARIHPQ